MKKINVNIKERAGKLPNDSKIFVDKSMSILDRVWAIMRLKGINQKQLAELMGKSEAEISDITHGVQNFTLRTISKLESALGEEIIKVL